MHIFYPREGKRVVPGDFMEKRTDKPGMEMLTYVCKKCGYDVLFFVGLQDIRQIKMKLCEECFEEKVK
jgi:hypothetical protein